MPITLELDPICAESHGRHTDATRRGVGGPGHNFALLSLCCRCVVALLSLCCRTVVALLSHCCRTVVAVWGTMLAGGNGAQLSLPLLPANMVPHTRAPGPRTVVFLSPHRNTSLKTPLLKHLS